MGGDKYYLLSSFQKSPLRFKTDSLSIDEPIFLHRFTSKYFIVIGIKGNIFVFDKETLRPRFVLNGNYFPNTLYNDSHENIWIGSIDKGLLLYKKKQIETFSIPDNFTNTHFLCVARKPTGAVLLGNYYGQIVETDGKYFIVHSLVKGNEAHWQRKVIVVGNKVFSFSEGGDYLNFSATLIRAVISLCT